MSRDMGSRDFHGSRDGSSLQDLLLGKISCSSLTCYPKINEITFQKHPTYE